MDQHFKSEGQGHKMSIFEIFDKYCKDDKKINNMVIEVYAYTIYSKNRMGQELKSEGQGHKIYIFKNGENQEFKLIWTNIRKYCRR